MTREDETLFQSDTLFAELILPVPVAKFFTYRVPRALNDKVKVGQRAIVQFGQRKILTGVIYNLHSSPPKEYEAKPILELLDETEVIYTQQFKLYEWYKSILPTTRKRLPLISQRKNNYCSSICKLNP